MPIVVNLYVEGVTRENYEAAQKFTKWGSQPPEGGLFHVASFDEKGMYVTDIFESKEDWDRFLNNTLMPAMNQVGIKTEPKVWLSNVYNLYTPAFKPTRTISTERPSSSMSTRMQ